MVLVVGLSVFIVVHRKEKMTAAQIAAVLAKAKGNKSGVFSLDDLKALGKTGNIETDWMKQSNPEGLLAGGGNAVLSVKDLKAGYYQVPGLDGAYYFDPATGQAPKEFIDWANALKPTDRDPFTGNPKGFIPAEGGPEASFKSRADQSAEIIKNENDIFAEVRAGASYQDAQDKVLGLGKYQTSMWAVNGNDRVGMDFNKNPQPSMFKDVSKTADKTPSGGFGVGSSYGYWRVDASGREWVSTATAKDLAENEASAAANAATLNQHNADAYYGLQEERIARGENPDTGISDAAKVRIWETYNRISDPAQRAAYIQVQDPGNLVPELREARISARNAPGGMGAEYKKLKSDMPATYEYWSPQRLGGSSKDNGQIKVTIGDVFMTDKMTGRETLYGNVPIAGEYLANKKDSTTSVMDRVGGGIMGAFVGFTTSIFTGNPFLGVIAGAYFGAGGPTNRMSAGNLLKGDFSGMNSWKQNQPHEADIKEIFITVGTAAAMAGVQSSWANHTGGTYSLPGQVQGEGPNAGIFGGGAWNRGRVSTMEP